ncbi:hypothetical protein [Eremococcus coleocola]|uniref:hypothetical protein n=1 Tax=Eremococcus coleocola TaxID=88132 RepID=UPI00040B3F4B|nr:hypothetical protein [Eremococcus coleocola]
MKLEVITSPDRIDFQEQVSEFYEDFFVIGTHFTQQVVVDRRGNHVVYHTAYIRYLEGDPEDLKESMLETILADYDVNALSAPTDLMSFLKELRENFGDWDD